MMGVRSRGFSLLELIIVILIMSLLAILVTPSLTRTISHMEVKSTAKKISAILRSCRNNAANKNRTYQVSLDSESRVVSVSSAEEGEEKLTLEETYPLPKEIRMEKIDVGKTFFESSAPSFEFYPNGGANGGTAVIRGGENQGFSIGVDFLTGSVKVEPAKER